MAIDISKIQDSKHILDILMQCEDVLDSLDIYVYKNWFSGEVISGPKISRYWVTIELKYPLDKMPDPRGSLRLIKYGIKAKFIKKERKTTPNVYAEITPNDDPRDESIWIIKLSFPRRLMSNIEDSSNDDFYEDEVDIEDIDSAKDSGIDNESMYMSGDTNENQ